MSTSKHIDLICVIVVALALLLTLGFVNGRSLGIQVVSDGDGAEDGYFTQNDLDGGWDATDANVVTLAGDDTAISGGGYVLDGSVHIVSPGRYVLSGTLDGSVVVDAGSGDKIWLRLDGADISCADGAAIQVEEAEKVFLTLAPGTENTVSSSAFSDADSGVDGAIFSRDDLTINGSGSLTVESACHGVVGNDDLVVTGCTLSVTADQDALHANDSVRLHDAHLTLHAGDDGVTVSNDDGVTVSNDDGTGYFYMDAGTLSIPACVEGVEGQQITVAGGEIDVTPTDDGFNATETDSLLSITGGTVRVVNETGRDADGLDSNGSIDISGGYVFLSVSDSGGSAALDAGTESGGTCTVRGGTVIAAGSSAMAECFDADSAQGFLVSSTQGAAGSTVRLTDGSGTVLIDETIPCSFSNLILSAPGLADGDAVTLDVNGASSQLTIDTASAAQSGGMGGRMGGMGGHMGGMFGGRGAFGQTGDPANSTSAQPTGVALAADMAAPQSGADGAAQTPPEGTESMTPPDGMTPPEGAIDSADAPTPPEGAEGMTRPEGADGAAAFGGRGGFGGMRENGERGGWTEEQTTTQPNALTPTAAALVLISSLALLAGIVVALLIKH